MREGLIIEFSYHGCQTWVVVSVNDCRATIIPMTGKNPNDPAEVFEEAHPGATGISPNSECKTRGYIKGQIRKREQRMVQSAAQSVQPRPVAHSKKVLLDALPSIPEDPLPDDPIIMAILTSTRELFSSADH